MSIKLRGVVVIALSATVLAGVGTAAAAVIHHTGPLSGGVINACFKTAEASNGSHAVVLENTGHACPSGYTCSGKAPTLSADVLPIAQTNCAVAAATVGFASDWHMPNGMILVIGIWSMMLASGTMLVIT